MKIAIVILCLSACVFAQEPKATGNAKQPAQASAPELPRPFTSQQLERLQALQTQIALAEAQIEAASARRELANERQQWIFKDACRDAGIALDECAPATNQQGAAFGVKRAGKVKP
jgi:hypothetical protein